MQLHDPIYFDGFVALRARSSTLKPIYDFNFRLGIKTYYSKNKLNSESKMFSLSKIIKKPSKFAIFSFSKSKISEKDSYSIVSIEKSNFYY
jgi:hypothetical protein